MPSWTNLAIDMPPITRLGPANEGDWNLAFADGFRFRRLGIHCRMSRA